MPAPRVTILPEITVDWPESSDAMRPAPTAQITLRLGYENNLHEFEIERIELELPNCPDIEAAKAAAFVYAKGFGSFLSKCRQCGVHYGRATVHTGDDGLVQGSVDAVVIFEPAGLLFTVLVPGEADVTKLEEHAAGFLEQAGKAIAQVAAKTVAQNRATKALREQRERGLPQWLRDAMSADESELAA